MHEIDLIPESYLRRRQFLRWFKQAAISLGLITTSVVGSYLLLLAETRQLEEKVKQLQAQRSISGQQRKKLEGLNTSKQELKQQLDLLAGLRGGSSARQMFTTVDKAFSDNSVWFTDWQFLRAGTATQKDPKTVNTGYFIVVPKDGRQQTEAWQIETRMTINGQALDHAALSGFVSRLVKQPDIDQVRVVRTGLIEINAQKLINFSLDIGVATHPGGAQG